jgi:DNA polymerase-3 subunit gamma/tau
VAQRNGAGALAELDAAVADGVDIGQLLEQLLGSLRDCMASAVGCPPDAFLFTSSEEHGRVTELASQLGLETILAMIQIVEQTLSRLRYSTQTRTLCEMALARMCSLEALDDLPALIAELQGTGGGAPAGGVASRSPSAAASGGEAKKKAESDIPLRGNGGGIDSPPAPQNSPRRDPPHAISAPRALAENTAEAIWREALANLSDLLAENAAFCQRVELVGARNDPGSANAANLAPKRLAATFPTKYNSCKSFCERPDQLEKLERALAEVTGEPVVVEFVLAADPTPVAGGTPERKPASSRQLLADVADHPMVRRANELFEAYPVRVEPPGG